MALTQETALVERLVGCEQHGHVWTAYGPWASKEWWEESKGLSFHVHAFCAKGSHWTEALLGPLVDQDLESPPLATRFRSEVLQLNLFFAVGLLAIVLGACGNPAPCNGGATYTFTEACEVLAGGIDHNPACEDAGVTADESKCGSILQSGACANATVWCEAPIDQANSAGNAAPTCAAATAVPFTAECD